MRKLTPIALVLVGLMVVACGVEEQPSVVAGKGDSEVEMVDLCLHVPVGSCGVGGGDYCVTTSHGSPGEPCTCEDKSRTGVVCYGKSHVVQRGQRKTSDLGPYESCAYEEVPAGACSIGGLQWCLDPYARGNDCTCSGSSGIICRN